MRYLTALFIKFAMCTAVLSMVLGGFYGVSFANILTISILLTGTSFIIGDLYVLPSFENTSAAITDFVLTFIGVWLLGSLMITETINLGVASFISAVFITIGEIFFHIYMDNRVLTNETHTKQTKNRYQQLQTEFSEELDLKRKNVQKKN